MQPQTPQQTPAMELPRLPEPVQSKQPGAQKGMGTQPPPPFIHPPTSPMLTSPSDPQRPHDEPEMNLRGGEEGRGMCPGRFCFIIPCPLPCNCCIIPCPC